MILFKLSRKFFALNFKQRAVIKHNELVKEMLDSLSYIHTQPKISLFGALQEYKKVSDNLMYKIFTNSQMLSKGVFNETLVTNYVPLKRSMDSLDDELRQKLDVELEAMMINLLTILNKIDELEPIPNSITSTKEKQNLYIMFHNAISKLFLYEYIGMKSKSIKLYKAFRDSFNKHTEGLNYLEMNKSMYYFRVWILLRLLEYAVNNRTVHVKDLCCDFQNVLKEIDRLNIHIKANFYGWLRADLQKMPSLYRLYYSQIDLFCKNYVATDFDLNHMSSKEAEFHFKSVSAILCHFTVEEVNNLFNVEFINRIFINRIKKYPDFADQYAEVIFDIFDKTKNITTFQLNPETAGLLLEKLEEMYFRANLNNYKKILLTYFWLAQYNIGSRPDSRFNYLVKYIKRWNNTVTNLIESRGFEFQHAIRIDLMIAQYAMNNINQNDEELIHEAKQRIAYLSEKCLFDSNTSALTLVIKLCIFNNVHKDTNIGSILPEGSLYFNRYMQTFMNNISVFNINDLNRILSSLSFADPQKLEQFYVLVYANYFSLVQRSGPFIINMSYWHALLSCNSSVFFNSEYLNHKFTEFIDYYTEELKKNKAIMFFPVQNFNAFHSICSQLETIHKFLLSSQNKYVDDNVKNSAEWKSLHKLMGLCLEVVFIGFEEFVMNSNFNSCIYVKNTYIDVHLLMVTLRWINVHPDFMPKSEKFICTLFKNRVTEIINEPNFEFFDEILETALTDPDFPLHMKQWLVESNSTFFGFVENKLSTQTFETYMYSEELLEILWNFLWSSKSAGMTWDDRTLYILKTALRTTLSNSNQKLDLGKRIDYLAKLVYIDPITNDFNMQTMNTLAREYWGAYFTYTDDDTKDDQLNYIEMKLYIILQRLFLKHATDAESMGDNYKELYSHLYNKLQRLDKAWVLTNYNVSNSALRISSFACLHLIMESGLQFKRKSFFGLACEFYLENSKTYIHFVDKQRAKEKNDLWVYELLADASGAKLICINLDEIGHYPQEIIGYMREKLKLVNN